jgi:hypothetical protein
MACNPAPKAYCVLAEKRCRFNSLQLSVKLIVKIIDSIESRARKVGGRNAQKEAGAQSATRAVPDRCAA